MSAQPSLTNIGTVSNVRDSRPRLHILVGIPGCGKSTFAQTLAHDQRVKHISSDALRAELAADETDQSKNDLVFKVFHNMIRWHLSLGHDVIADSTALTRNARTKLSAIADSEGVESHVYLFRNAQEAVMRNQRRDRVVPADVMLRMLEKYERTLLDLPQESYTSVTEIRSYT